MDSTRRCVGAFASGVAGPSRRFLLPVVSRILGILIAVGSRFANRRFVFAVAAVAIIAAKLTHLFVHFSALSTSDIIRWGPTFFSQDLSILLVLRFLLDGPMFASLRWLRYIVSTLAAFAILFVLSLASISISFFFVAGSELHWRNIGLANDKSSMKMLMTGLFACALTLFGIAFMSWLLQDIIYVVAGVVIDILKWPFVYALNKFSIRQHLPMNVKYDHIPQQDVELASDHFSKDEDDNTSEVQQHPPRATKWTVLLYTGVGLALLYNVVLNIVRPEESSLIFMSWTLPLLPFVDFARSSPNLATMIPLHGTSINRDWDNRTAIADPIQLSWLPKDPLPGFDDWYKPGKKHYLASEDPLKVSNLGEDIIPALRNKLADIDIRNVMLIKLESTRKDVFPIKKGSYMWDRLANSWENKIMPEAAAKKLGSLTPTANFLTGDYDDGFDHTEKKRRGGINCNNDHTTATYTLKSLTGTICGITPLVADFNIEYQHHIYQPCLPHIFGAFNSLLEKGTGNSSDFTSYKWKSYYMQSVTETYDKQNHLTPVLGYPPENIINKEYLKKDTAKFGKDQLPDVNYYGMAEVALEKYVRDAFAQGKKDNERVFLTHLTSTSHHPFGIPKEVEYTALADDKNLNDLSHYLNAIGYVDGWLKKILDILDDEGVADETLVILVGDHGLSIPENNGLTPYFNPNIGNFHVPLVLSHPKLPPIDINDPVNSMQILPTVLDLLLETGSLQNASSQAAKDLVANYEGQSLLRPLKKETKSGQGAWQFTVMNPGRAKLSVRDPRQESWRLVVPIVENIEWRFTDLSSDPHEKNGIRAFGFIEFLKKVEKEHGVKASKWAEEGAFMTRWWVEENSHRWEFNPAA